MTLRDKLHDNLDEFLDKLDEIDGNSIDEHDEYFENLEVNLKIDNITDLDKLEQAQFQKVDFKNLITIHF